MVPWAFATASAFSSAMKPAGTFGGRKHAQSEFEKARTGTTAPLGPWSFESPSRPPSARTDQGRRLQRLRSSAGALQLTRRQPEVRNAERSRESRESQDSHTKRSAVTQSALKRSTWSSVIARGAPFDVFRLLRVVQPLQRSPTEPSTHCAGLRGLSPDALDSTRCLAPCQPARTRAGRARLSFIRAMRCTAAALALVAACTCVFAAPAAEPRTGLVSRVPHLDYQCPSCTLAALVSVASARAAMARLRSGNSVERC